MPSDYDVIVVGVGGMGSAACAHLAERGVDVLGLERYGIPHGEGSSHGSTRIIRYAYSEGESYVPLLERAYELWRDLDAGHDRDLLTTTGSLTVGPPDEGLVPDARDALDAHGKAYDYLDAAGLEARFPYAVDDDWRAIYQPDGGFLDPEQSIVAHVDRAHANGATIKGREAVTAWREDDSGVTVDTEKGTYTADHLVVAAGAWSPDLCPGLADHLTVERQVMGWFQPTDPAAFTPDAFPVFMVETGGNELYGFPRHDRPGMKVGVHHHRNEETDPDALADPTPADETLVRDTLTDYLPDAAGDTLGLATCIYTNTPDRDFVLGALPDTDRVTVAAGFSGHGFKFTSVVGEILADLALDGRTDHPIAGFDPARFD